MFHYGVIIEMVAEDIKSLTNHFWCWTSSGVSISGDWRSGLTAEALVLDATSSIFRPSSLKQAGWTHVILTMPLPGVKYSAAPPPPTTTDKIQPQCQQRREMAFCQVGIVWESFGTVQFQ
eukprot:3593230-Ditylum_brightwellii.AAC.1